MRKSIIDRSQCQVRVYSFDTVTDRRLTTVQYSSNLEMCRRYKSNSMKLLLSGRSKLDRVSYQHNPWQRFGNNGSSSSESHSTAGASWRLRTGAARETSRQRPRFLSALNASMEISWLVFEGQITFIILEDKTPPKTANSGILIPSFSFW